MTLIKKTWSAIFVIFHSEIRECPFFAFSEDQKPCKKGFVQKMGAKKGPPVYSLTRFWTHSGQIQSPFSILKIQIFWTGKKSLEKEHVPVGANLENK